MKRGAAGAHLPSPWLFELVKHPARRQRRLQLGHHLHGALSDTWGPIIHMSPIINMGSIIYMASYFTMPPNPRGAYHLYEPQNLPGHHVNEGIYTGAKNLHYIRIYLITRNSKIPYRLNQVSLNVFLHLLNLFSFVGTDFHNLETE